MAAVLPFRYAALRRERAVLSQRPPDGVALLRLPGRAFAADMGSWTAIGLIMMAVYHGFYAPYATTGVKILLGCLAFGAFGGMLNYLNAESRLIRILEDAPVALPSGGRVVPVSRKIVAMTVAILVTISSAILLMMLNDVYYLLEHREMGGAPVYWGVFKEIVFAFAVLLTISLMVIKRFADNLRRTLYIQMAAMTAISRGDLEKHVPILSNDEFAVFAQRTNDMIEGLKDRDFCRASFDKYVSPEVSRKILRKEISPSGELCDVTILFCDLRGYTGFVEKRNPRDVVAFLNRYFSEMEQIIRRHQGMVLQYIGDEIEAVFGAPTPLDNHPDKAVAAAVAMRGALARMNADLLGQGMDAVAHGIGIHTGIVLAGDVGSETRKVYAMVGDTVNTASRLQVLNKRCGTDILISRSTVERLTRDSDTLKSLGTFPVKGKSEEVEVFTRI